MTYEQSRLLKPSTYSWRGDFCFRVWDKTHFCGSVWDRQQRNERQQQQHTNNSQQFDPHQLTGRYFHGFQNTSQVNHTSDIPLLLLGEKLPSTLDNRDAAWSSKSTSKIQTTTNSHRCSYWGCETHLSTKTSKCALTRIRTASSVCAHIQRSSITACRGDRLTGQWKIWRIGGNSWLMQGFSCHIIFPNTPT